MRNLKLLAVLLVAMLAAIGAAGCGGDADETSAAGDEGNTTSTMPSMNMDDESSASRSDGVESPAADLRLTLDRLLGEHALLAAFATQKGFSGEKDFGEIAKALDRNSVELGEAIASVYGQEAGRKFLDGDLLWRDHIGFFVDYTVGLAKNDKAMQKKAVGNLKGYNEAFASFLAGATELPVDALREGIGEHITQLKGQIDAYAAGDYDEAYALARKAYAHMYMLGTTLACAIVEQSPEKFAS